MRDLLVLLLFLSSCRARLLELELEDFQGVGRSIVTRQNASDGKVVHLLYDNIIRYEMCVHSPLEMTISNIFFSNDADNKGDEISVYMDEKLVGSFKTNQPELLRLSEWNNFRPSGVIGESFRLDYGRHMLTIRVTQADDFGVELDNIQFEVGNAIITNRNLTCDVYCFDDINFETPRAAADIDGFKIKKFNKATVCAEEENVKVAFYHDTASNFQIKATRPKYATCSNSREADFRDCKLASPAWKFNDVQLSSGPPIVHKTHRASLTVDNSETSARVAVTFDMSGFSITRGQGERQTAGKLFVMLGKLDTTEAAFAKVSYLGRTGRLEQGTEFTFDQEFPSNVWEIPDNFWGDNNGNKIIIEINTVDNTFNGVYVKEIRLEKRDMQVRPFIIYNDGIFLFEGLHRDPWWLKQTAMKVNMVEGGVSGKVFDDVANLRLYMKKPYDDGYSQIFVIHDDGHSRVQPVTPHGMDWTPFGSSLVIGPTSPNVQRPFVSIKSIDLVPSKLMMTIRYHDESSLVLKVVASPTETIVKIRKYKTTKDRNQNALFTFLSTWVQNGYSYVDHMSVDGGVGDGIMKDFVGGDTRLGTRANFYRKCLSRLNTQSPDIEITVHGVSGDED
ncbi:uncharacterized protein LOC127707535 [Mytilus californianus]|uniref:uncharacterized protein LOC127707535 n=1 Tax=Mytilus californianus TaxID=6549 RepID=UPI0022478AD7|nr:uncharacterized protein LOC127707535 [Mytilus californianus]